MTRMEFSQVMVKLALAIQKPLMSEMVLEVYYRYLGDLPLDVLQAAADRVVIEHRWATFPTVAELRDMAMRVAIGNSILDETKAWALAWRAVGQMDPEIPSSVEKALKALPPIVAQVIRDFGINALCYGKEPIGVVRAQFTNFYKRRADAEWNQRLLPPAVKQAIASIGKMPASIAQNVAQNLGKIEG